MVDLQHYCRGVWNSLKISVQKRSEPTLNFDNQKLGFRGSVSENCRSLEKANLGTDN